MQLHTETQVLSIETEHDLVDRLRKSFASKMDAASERSLRDKLFPMGRGTAITWFDIAYAEALWAAILLVSGFLIFASVSLGPAAAVAFVVAVSPFISPILVFWFLAGAYCIWCQR
jgi:hypothetical protein